MESHANSPNRAQGINRVGHSADERMHAQSKATDEAGLGGNKRGTTPSCRRFYPSNPTSPAHDEFLRSRTFGARSDHNKQNHAMPPGGPNRTAASGPLAPPTPSPSHPTPPANPVRLNGHVEPTPGSKPLRFSSMQTHGSRKSYTEAALAQQRQIRSGVRRRSIPLTSSLTSSPDGSRYQSFFTTGRSNTFIFLST